MTTELTSATAAEADRLSIVYSTYRPVLSALIRTGTHPPAVMPTSSCCNRLNRCSVSLTWSPNVHGRYFSYPTQQLPLTSRRKQNVRHERRGVVANKKAVDRACHDVIVYVTVIRMAFMLTDQHRVASFDCRRWYRLALSNNFEVKCRLV